MSENKRRLQTQDLKLLRRLWPFARPDLLRPPNGSKETRGLNAPKGSNVLNGSPGQSTQRSKGS